MYYLSNFDYISQIKLKIKLGFKLNEFETVVFTFYCISLANKLLLFLKNYKGGVFYERYLFRCL